MIIHPYASACTIPGDLLILLNKTKISYSYTLYNHIIIGWLRVVFLTCLNSFLNGAFLGISWSQLIAYSSVQLHQLNLVKITSDMSRMETFYNFIWETLPLINSDAFTTDKLQHRSSPFHKVYRFTLSLVLSVSYYYTLVFDSLKCLLSFQDVSPCGIILLLPLIYDPVLLWESLLLW